MYCSPEFLQFTGYEESEVIGRNCRFLQGPATTKESREAMKNAINKQATEIVCLVNYKKSGDMFYNHLLLSPIFDESSKLVLYLGIQLRIVEISPEVLQTTPSRYIERIIEESNSSVSSSSLSSPPRNESMDSDDLLLLPPPITLRVLIPPSSVLKWN